MLNLQNIFEMTKYTNRYGDVFTFEENENGNIDWRGDFKYTRCGWNDDDNIIFVDPSGGPYIPVGTNMLLYALEGTVAGFVDHDDYWEIVLEDNVSLRTKNDHLVPPKDTL
jgi:hypothetical protein